MKKLTILTVALLALAACEHGGSTAGTDIMAFQPAHEGAPCVMSGAC